MFQGFKSSQGNLKSKSVGVRKNTHRILYTLIKDKGKEVNNMNYELEMALAYGTDLATILALAGIEPEELEDEEA